MGLANNHKYQEINYEYAEPKHRKTLTSLAILSVNYYHANMDYIDNFIPFIITLINKNKYQTIDAVNLSEDFKDEFGLVIPYHPMVAILDRARENGFLNYSHDGMLNPVYSKIDENDFSYESNEQLRKQEKVIKQFIYFAEKKYEKQVSTKEAEYLLLNFIDKYQMELFSDNLNKISVINNKENEFIFYKFILDVYNSEPSIFDYILDIVLGQALVDTLYYCENENSYRIDDLKGLKVYLDADLILILLGLGADEEKLKIYKQFFYELLRRNAKLCLFNHTYDELLHLLDNCLIWVENADFDPSKATLSARYCVENGFKKTDVQRLKIKISEILDEYKIDIESGPSYNELSSFQIDEDQLKKIITSIYKRSENKELTINRDVKSLSYLHKLRKGKRPQTFAEAEYIFITTNKALVYSNKKFEFFSNENNFHLPVCLTDIHLGTLLWLQSPAQFVELNKRKLIANCHAALQPNEIMLKKYIHEIERLYNDKELDSEQCYLLRTYQGALNLLQDKTLGNPNSFTDKTPLEIIEEIKTEIREEESKKYKEEKESHEKTTRDLLELNEQKNNEEKEKNNIIKQNEEALKKLTNLIYWLILILVFVIFACAVIYSELISKLTLFSVISIIVVIFVGCSSYLWSSEKIKRKISNLIEKKLFSK